MSAKSASDRPMTTTALDWRGHGANVDALLARVDEIKAEDVRSRDWSPCLLVLTSSIRSLSCACCLLAACERKCSRRSVLTCVVLFHGVRRRPSTPCS